MKDFLRNCFRFLYNIFSGQNAISRSTFLSLIPTNAKSLEIGPFSNPHLRGPNVYYFDVDNKEDIIKRAIAVNYVIADNLPDIHYVSPTGDLSIIEDTFDVVYSAHCIEHQPDLIKHLIDVEKLFNSGGKYYITIPDKRYSFDALLPTLDLGSVVEAYEEKRKVHQLANLIRHQALVVHNSPIRHWLSMHGTPGNSNAIVSHTRQALNQFKEAKGAYVDTHAWRFTPESFREIITQLNELNYINLQIERLYPTAFASNEFYAILKKK
ncbi:class I SAM-dependent methyltransferase [Spirosoma sp. BT702]|uniref:Class I SAM-dependent methyltransferase n=1 Tax=Spirosoma profusum TaxID=2771354 RepID=A0A927ATL9_9BACT|nr:class I SAM-dependent methyltransferase [Spirosoma profusum]MBD2700572.1 class I SAM-dependent methyltransferase [Spirosoma profusum]